MAETSQEPNGLRAHRQFRSLADVMSDDGEIFSW